MDDLKTLFFDRAVFAGHTAEFIDNSLHGIVPSDSSNLTLQDMDPNPRVSSYDRENFRAKEILLRLINRNSPLYTQWFCIQQGIITKITPRYYSAMDWFDELTDEEASKSLYCSPCEEEFKKSMVDNILHFQTQPS